MLRIRRKNKYGQSILEFITLIIFLLTVFFVFQKYIVRGFTGRWKTVGDALGGGYIYDPKKTLECAFDPVYTNQWYNVVCYEEGCMNSCFTVGGSEAACTDCITACVPPSGAEPNCED